MDKQSAVQQIEVYLEAASQNATLASDYAEQAGALRVPESCQYIVKIVTDQASQASEWLAVVRGLLQDIQDLDGEEVDDFYVQKAYDAMSEIDLFTKKGDRFLQFLVKAISE